MEKLQGAPLCAATGCEANATVEVILYDIYEHNGEVFFKRDKTCPYLCNQHVQANESGAQGERRPRGRVTYPYSNQDRAQGFTIYRPL